MTRNVDAAGASPTGGAATAPAWGATGPPNPLRWLAFAVVLLAAVMDLLDALVTNVAAPTIRADIGGGTVVVQWLGAGYTLALAAGLVLGGRLGDIYGRRTVFLVGAFGFTAASLLCAASVTPTMLIAARVAQGLFGAIMLPQGLGVIKEVFPPRELAKAFGVFGPVMGLSSVSGPTLAGALIDADLFGTGWRMIYLINLPIGLITVVGGWRFLPRTRGDATIRLDLVGAALVSLAAVLIVYPVVQGRELGWPLWIFGLMAASAVVFAVFGWYEVRKQAGGGQPLVIPSLFRKRAFTGGLVAGLAFFSALTGFALVFTVFLQVGLGYSPLKAGMSALPQAAGSVLGFIAAGSGLSQRFGRLLIHVGTAMSAIGIAVFFLILHGQGTGVSIWPLVPALLVMGIGMGLVLAPFFDIVLAGVEPHETGSASGTLTALQQFGSALGVAVLGTIFFGVLGGQIADAAGDSAAQLRTRLAAAGVPTPRQDTIVRLVQDCGRDSASVKDPQIQPASCRSLGGAIGQAAATARDPEAVTAAVSAAASDASRAGFVATMERTVWAAASLQLLTFLLAFLLPARAREEWGDGSHGGRQGTGAGTEPIAATPSGARTATGGAGGAHEASDVH